jgi:hypothetical protein
MSNITKTNDDYSLISLDIVNYKGDRFDAIASFIQFEIEESIFEGFVRGRIVLEDSIGWQEDLPLIGNETLEITYQRNTAIDTITSRTFQMYGIAEVKFAENKKLITVSFCSPEMIKNLNRRISKAYTSKTAADIINDLYNNFIKIPNSTKEIVIDDVVGIFDHVFPRVTPAEAINTICGMSAHRTQKRPLFFFYETVSGFKVNNLETLYLQEKKYTFDSTLNLKKEEIESNRKLQTMFGWQVIKSTDTIGLITEGAISNKMITYDPLSKSYTNVDYNHLNDFDQYNHITNNRVLNTDYQFNSPEQNIKFFTTKTYRRNSQYYIDNSPAVENTTKPEILYPYKRAISAEFNNYVLVASVGGGSLVEAGDKVELRIPAHEVNSVQEEDYTYSGEYIVTKVKNTFRTNSVSTEIYCQKDSLLESIK